MRMLAGLTPVVVLVFAAACGGGGGGTPATTGPQAPSGGAPVPTAAPPATTAAGGAAVTCADGAASGGPVLSFIGSHDVNPADGSVAVGGSITFTNNSSQNHKVKFTNAAPCNFTLIGKSTQVKFDAAGSYAWVCTIHPNFMKGTITVS
jgi:plastocyanin